MDNLKEFNSASHGGRNKATIIILIILLLACFGLLVYTYYSFKDQEQELTVAIEERVSVTSQYENLLLDYESLETTNDTLSAKLSIEQEKIKTLIAELKSVKANNKAEINKYKKELKTLRDIMKGFIHQIDSLNTLNIQLTEENKQIKEQYNTAKIENKQLSQKYEDANTKVAIASVIKAINLNVEAFNPKGKLTTKAKKTKRLGINFALDENPIAPVGIKKVYIRITDPNDHVLMSNEQNMFGFEGEQIAYSSVREIDYDGNVTPAVVYFEITGPELLEGDYKVDVFCDGNMIGSSITQLK